MIFAMIRNVNFFTLIRWTELKQVITMRTRTVDIHFRMTPSEARRLDANVKKTGMNRSEYLRTLVEGKQPCEKPDEAFYKMMGEMRAIGINLNQIAAKANVLGFVDQPRYEKEAARWRQFMLAVKEKFLEPK